MSENVWPCCMLSLRISLIFNGEYSYFLDETETGSSSMVYMQTRPLCLFESRHGFGLLRHGLLHSSLLRRIWGKVGSYSNCAPWKGHKSLSGALHKFDTLHCGNLLDAETFTFEALTLWFRFVPLIKGISRLRARRRMWPMASRIAHRWVLVSILQEWW